MPLLHLLVSAILLITPSAQAAMLSCKAIYRSLDKQNKSIEREVAMAITFDANGVTKYEVDLEGKFLSVTERKDGLLGQISSAPDYLKGSVSRGDVDASGFYTLTEVDGPTIHRIVCKKDA